MMTEKEESEHLAMVHTDPAGEIRALAKCHKHMMSSARKEVTRALKLLIRSLCASEGIRWVAEDEVVEVQVIAFPDQFGDAVEIKLASRMTTAEARELAGRLLNAAENMEKA